MPVISIFCGAFCWEDDLVGPLVERTGFRLIGDRDIVALASQRYDLPEEKIVKAFSSRTSVFNSFTHEKERAKALLRRTTAEVLADHRLLIHGFCSHLIPARITHVLRVCLVAESRFRVERARSIHGLSEKEALRRVQRNDEDRVAWVQAVRGVANPRDPSLYDIVVPFPAAEPDDAVELIMENLGKDVLQPTDESRAAQADFVIASAVGEVLTREGHDVDVECEDGLVTLTINRNVLRLRKLEEELKGIAATIDGVESVTTRVGKGFHKSDIYRRFDVEAPSRVLLVDDERDFVQSLSKRLLLRDVGSAIAFDGESALDVVREDEPEVMILDLKMPGIDGLEVLRQVKQTSPEIEVIILTGHGSDEDRSLCMELGAFAYLRKPVDIDVLSETLERAHQKVRQSARSREKGQPGSRSL